MSQKSKVLWTEGLFVRPQHFQKQDDYHETLLERRVGDLVPYGWGVTKLVLDEDLLGQGKIGILELDAVLPDGTPIRVPKDAEISSLLEPSSDIKNQRVYLALPLRNVSQAMNRYVRMQQHVPDAYSTHGSEADVDFLKPSLKLILEGEDRSDYATLAVCRIREVTATGKVELDGAHIPPTLNCEANRHLAGYVKEVAGLLRNRGESMAGSAVSSGHSGVAEVKDLMWLQVVNRFEPLFLHLQDLDKLHPERLFSYCIQLAGEIATFATDEKRPIEFPAYNHNNLRESFHTVMEELRKLLSVVLDPNVFQIPLEYKGPGRGVGLYIAPMRELSGHVNMRDLVEAADFYLGIKVDLPAEIMHHEFPQQVKIGPVESIERMVNVNLGGVKIGFTQVPRQIPFHNGFTYYALQQGSRHWQELAYSNGLAIYLGEKYQDVQLELWAVKR